MDENSVTKRHYNEILTDNSKIGYCNQCKSCAFWGSDVWSNKFDKANCDMYPYPDHKPTKVLNNTGRCEYFVERTSE